MGSNSMEQSPKEADSHSGGQEILHILQNLKVHYHAHKTPPLGLTLNQVIQSTLLDPTSARSISMLFSHAWLHLTSDFFPSCFLPIKSYEFHTSLACAICSSFSFFLNPSSLDEWYRLHNSVLYILMLLPPVKPYSPQYPALP